MATQTLWAITDELAEVGALIADGEGELTPDIEARLDALEGALEDKVERIALYIRESQLEAEKAKAEKDRLGAIQKSHENTASGLKNYLQHCLVSVPGQSVKTHRARVRIQKNSQPSIRWTKSIHELPEGYRRTTIAPDLDAVREDLAVDATPPDGFEVVQGYHVRIS